ncbi:MAG: hypothetical protein MI974_08825 [Chitinophagales bacterium]|nr:hypothetical protein [Chitinophagales bacterium]
MKRKNLGRFAFFLAINIFVQAVFAPLTMALTSGPKQPEFSTFEPVTTTNMVNPFTGDFTYNLPVVNIPGTDGGGYALSLSYHSGYSSEQEASWVGFGWTLNPGAINRNKRGIPDDYNGETIKRFNKTKPNLTVSATANTNIEAFSQNIGFSAGRTITLNNYRGISSHNSFGITAFGLASLSLTDASDEAVFSFKIRPEGILRLTKKKGEDTEDNSFNENAKAKESEESGRRFQFKLFEKDRIVHNALRQLGSAFDQILPSASYSATTFEKYWGVNLALQLGNIQINPAPAPVGPEVGFTGNINFQKSRSEANFEGLGYMYSPSLSIYEDNKVISDFYTEKNAPYTKQNTILGIPHTNADIFSLSGEGLQGGFRYHLPSPGHYFIGKEASHIGGGFAGIEFMVGTNAGLGVSLGVNYSQLKSELWTSKDKEEISQFDFDHRASGQFRFTNDKGGFVSPTSSTAISLYELTGNRNRIGFGSPGLASPTDLQTTVSFGNSSSLIKAKAASQANTVNNRFNKSSNVAEVNGAINALNQESLTEFQIVNEEGNLYTYGLPVLNFNELSCQFGLPLEMARGVKCSSAQRNNCIEDNHIVYQTTRYKDDDSHSMLIPDVGEHNLLLGEVQEEPYAGTYLLTQITTPEYVDLTDDGPSEDDFGGWTSFHYKQHYGVDAPYHWRIPYNGLLYAKNRISDREDDFGSVQAGDREVYSLQAIETKSHIALFVTNSTVPSDFASYFPGGMPPGAEKYLSGSGEVRQDGLGARKISGNQDIASSTPSIQDAQQQVVRLDKIVLYAKGQPEYPVQTTRFEYDYSICEGLPNSIGNMGKLTLKKVWFEYEGKFRTQISPYEFHYQYKAKADYPQDLVSQYNGTPMADFFNLNNTFSSNAQNPRYAVNKLDSWGNPQFDGAERHRKMQVGTYQGNRDSGATFDPAAWQLKQITLPSGGEILVEYEQKNYQYVQDRRATALVPLLSTNGDDEFVLDIDALGVEESEIPHLIQLIEEYYGEQGKSERVFFKFLFSFDRSTPSLDNCRSEYISGYATFKGVRRQGNRVIISLEEGNSGGRTFLPRQACFDYLVANAYGKTSSDCLLEIDSAIRELLGGVRDIGEGDVGGALNILKGSLQVAEAVSSDLTQYIADVDNATYSNFCMQIAPALSYLKIPLPHAKRGGGIRVKRLLMLDNGIEDGTPAIYGSEYRYENQDGSTSGIATNEPQEMHSENALVTFLERKKQGGNLGPIKLESTDKQQNEGPIGESLLPAASVGHSRVEIHNIHSGRTSSGFSVYEYLTVKDYPFDKVYTYDEGNDIEPGKGFLSSDLDDNTIQKQLILPIVFFKYERNQTWATQGYRFILTNMHGRQKSVSHYGLAANEASYPVSQQVFTYYEPGEKIRVLRADGSYVFSNPGKEVEVVMEAKSMQFRSFDLNAEFDVSIGAAFLPPVYALVGALFSMQNKSLSTHVTSKVIRYPTYVKKVTTLQDGIYTSIENVAFDEFTGAPIIKKSLGSHSTNENTPEANYQYAIEIPASHIEQYQLGPRSANLENTNQLKTIAATYETYGILGNPTAGNNFSLNNLLSASVQTYSTTSLNRNWLDQTVQNEYSDANTPNARSALDRIWRPHATYVYKTGLSSLNQGIASSGIFTSFNPFNWETPTNNGPDWLRLNEVTKYSPHGNSLEERNIIGIYSSARYGYNKMLPTMLAQNSQYNSIGFQSFEDGNYSDQSSHSGGQSLLLSPGAASNAVFSSLTRNSHLDSKGAWLKFWVNSPSKERVLANILSVEINDFTLEDLEFVAQTGEWMLFRTFISPEEFEQINQSTLEVTFENTTTVPLYIDDCRFQPHDATSTCYVYDSKNYRLLAQFDDNFFGLFYQYNDEGKLVKKLIETERGLQTVQETQYHTPTKPK